MEHVNPRSLENATALPSSPVYPSQAELLKFFRYDEKTGKLYNRIKRMKAKAGKEAGSECCIGGTVYRNVGFNGRRFRSHNLIWVMAHGYLPDGYEIDHINGLGDDNRLDNLRLVTHAENMRNTKRRNDNTSGVVGISEHRGKWRAYINVNGKQHYLGCHDNINAAIASRRSAEVIHGFHQNHGRSAKATHGLHAAA